VTGFVDGAQLYVILDVPVLDRELFLGGLPS
jgi:hypothetical protein